MSIAVHWKNQDQTVLQLDYAGPSLSWADYDAALEKSFRMIREVAHPVTVIHNAGRVTLPKGSVFQHLRRSVENAPGNVDKMLNVFQHPFTRGVASVVGRLAGADEGRFTIVSSLEEAYLLLHEQRSQIPQ